MTILAYIFILAFILFFGGIWANAKSEEDHYGFLFFVVVVLGLSGLLMAFGILGLLPELTWS